MMTLTPSIAEHNTIFETDKLSQCQTNVLHCASQMVTLIPAYSPSFVGDTVLILGGHQHLS